MLLFLIVHKQKSMAVQFNHRSSLSLELLWTRESFLLNIDVGNLNRLTCCLLLDFIFLLKVLFKSHTFEFYQFKVFFNLLICMIRLNRIFFFSRLFHYLCGNSWLNFKLQFYIILDRFLLRLLGLRGDNLSGFTHFQPGWFGH